MKTALLNRIHAKLGRDTAKFVFKKAACFPEGKKVVSFTFDDFPLSAIKNGARLLEKYNSRGTFYIALSLADSDCPVGRIAAHQNIVNLAQQGHEIGGHTYSHVKCTHRSPKTIQNDCQKNRQVASEIGNLTLESFSYPFGAIDPMSKRIIGKTYGNARTTTPFINRQIIDLAALGSVNLYRDTQAEMINSRIEDLDNLGGWLIFHTHDVTENPSKFGCTIDFFEMVVKSCIERGFQILPILDAAKLAKPKI